MRKKVLSLVLIGLLLNLSFMCSAVKAGTKGEEREAKIRAGIAKLGTGSESVVKVKLKDGTIIKGYISEITEQGFTVTNGNLATAKNVLYPEVSQIRGNNLSKGVKIAIGIGIFLTVLIIIGVLTKGNIDIV